ncbi:hypothetical protein PtA15_15A45 [Puccinia triticina]|uniref:Uncharacterized protein n=1 Tax=Puccinia triticina TaxID=208348 RepID=A0ABY7D245_9BASI|nr:uncharacterized protein PtA15_15A45 [Puccinia triticina]WAQ91656.1 hypothetical protein PtA15_15A45 [Puccinia triticina]
MISQTNAQPGTSATGQPEPESTPPCPKQRAESSANGLPLPDSVPPVVSETNAQSGASTNGQPESHSKPTSSKRRAESSFPEDASNGLPQPNPLSRPRVESSLPQEDELADLPQSHISSETPQLDPAYPSKRPRSYPTPMLDPIRRRPAWIVERHLATLADNGKNSNRACLGVDLINFSDSAEVPQPLALLQYNNSSIHPNSPSTKDHNGGVDPRPNSTQVPAQGHSTQSYDFGSPAARSPFQETALEPADLASSTSKIQPAHGEQWGSSSEDPLIPVNGLSDEQTSVPQLLPLVLNYHPIECPTPVTTSLNPIPFEQELPSVEYNQEEIQAPDLLIDLDSFPSVEVTEDQSSSRVPTAIHGDLAGLMPEGFNSPRLLLHGSTDPTTFEAAMASNPRPGSSNTIASELFHHQPHHNAASQSLPDPPPLPRSVTPSGDASPQLPASLETANKSAQHQRDHNTANRSLQDPPLLLPSATPRGDASQQLPAGPEAVNEPARHPPDYNTADQSLADPPPLPPSATPRGDASQQLPAGPEAVNEPARHPPDYKSVTPRGDASPQLPASLETANESARHQRDHNTANRSLQDPPSLPPSATPRGDASQKLPAGPEAVNKPARHPPDYNTADQSLADPPPLPPSATPRGDASQQLPAGPEAVNEPARHQPDHNTADQSLADPPPLPPKAVNEPARHQPDHNTADQSLADPPPLPPSATPRSNAFQQLPAGPEAVNEPARHQPDYNTGDPSLPDPPPLPPSVAPSGDASQQLPASLEAANKPADHHQADCNIADQNLPDPLLQVLPSCDVGIPSSHLGKHPPTASTESPREEDLDQRRKRLKERQWHTDPKKLTIAKIKEVLTEFAIKPHSSDKKENYVKHYETLAKQQEEVWAKYLEEKELWAKHSGPSCERHQANKETQKTPQLDQEIPVNVPVTQSKTAKGKQRADDPAHVGGSLSVRSVKVLEPPNLCDKDSVEPVPEIPDLINLSPAVNPPRQLPSHKQPGPSTAQQFKTPFPTQRLIRWAATVDDAMHQMDVDDPPIHTDKPDDPAVPGNLLDIAKSLLQSMQTIATGVSSLQATPASDPTHSGAASRLRPPSRAVPSDQEEEIHKTPSARPRGRRATPRPAPSGPIPRGGPIPDAIRQHCATLLGRGPRDLLPPPATAAERRSWIYTLEQQSDGHASDTNSNSSVARDNLGLPTSTAANTFLWDLAVWIFMTLVDAGKYKDVTRETCSEEMTPEQRALRDKAHRRNTRRSRLREWRISTLLSEPSLAQLLPIVESCCSEDKTDDEAPEPPNARQKSCVTLTMPWRHSRVTRLMMELDRIRSNRRDKHSNAPPTRTRRQSANPNQSTVSAPHGLPIGTYNQDWLRQLLGYDAESLKPTTAPAIGHFIEVLKTL